MFFIFFLYKRVCKDAITKSIGDSCVDAALVEMVIKEREIAKKKQKENEKKVKKNETKKSPAVQYTKSKPKKTKNKFVEYASNDSVLGKLDAGKFNKKILIAI